MMGNETLAAMRARLAAAMAAPDGGRASSEGRSEVAEALERFLAGPTPGRGKASPASNTGPKRRSTARRTRG